MMSSTYNLEIVVREDVERRRPVNMDDEMGEALRAAVVATRAKIDEAFGQRVKFSARFKDA